MLVRIFFFLAVLQFADVIQAHEKRSTSSNILSQNCRIRSKALPDEILTQLPKDQSGLVITAVPSGSPLNAKWQLNQLNVDGSTYFEFQNRQFETFMNNYYYSEMWMVSGASKDFSTSNKRDTLWIVDPPQLNVPVTIKHAITGSYLTIPKGSFAQRNVILSSKPSAQESKWEILC